MKRNRYIQEISAQDTWPLRQAVMWPDKSLSYVQLEKDEEGIHLGLFNEEQLISVLSLFIDGDQAQFRKFATQVSKQGKGHGSVLLNHAFELLKERDVTRIWCNARQEKSSFYERFGMKETPHTFTKGGIDYVIMEKFDP